MVFSSIRIPLHWCQPSFQQLSKRHRRARIISNRRLFWVLLSCLSLRQSSFVYALPGTNHALISSESSADSHRQQAYVRSIISNLTGSAGAPPSDLNPATSLSPPPELRNTPHCFVADTDSTPYIVDTGANRVILNDVKLFTKFHPITGSVNGIGGSPVTIRGVGEVRLPLRADDGTVDCITIPDAAYVPTSPYHLLPPQLLVKYLKRSKFLVDDFKQNDDCYLFVYSDSSTSKSRTLTVPLSPNELFMFWANPGYSSFFARASAYAADGVLLLALHMSSLRTPLLLHHLLII